MENQEEAPKRITNNPKLEWLNRGSLLDEARRLNKPIGVVQPTEKYIPPHLRPHVPNVIPLNGGEDEENGMQPDNVWVIVAVIIGLIAFFAFFGQLSGYTRLR